MQRVALAVQTCFRGQRILRKVGGLWVLECEHDEGTCGVIVSTAREIPLDPARVSASSTSYRFEEDESPFVGLLQVEAV